MENKYSVIFHPKAEKEYLESVQWYENALIGLGQQFVNEIEKAIIQINNSPHIFPVKKLQLREV
jgi:hypothetical protein